MKKRHEKKKLKKEVDYIKKYGAGNWLSRMLRHYLEKRLKEVL